MLKRITQYILTKYNVSWMDPRCGCPRSPDVKFMSPCPDHSEGK